MIFPDFSLVQFPGRRLANAREIYNNRHLDDRFHWEDYAFAVPCDLDSEKDFKVQEKMFYAERYGGDGLCNNGGGGRVGALGNYQVKGIGRTPLAAIDADFWHSHGGLTFVHAVAEATWSEILAQALPFSAVRCISVIDPGLRCWVKGARGAKQLTSRAMVIRQNAMRPAHFERVYKFQTSHIASLIPDVSRAEHMAANIETWLPKKDLNSFAPTPQNGNTVVDGLEEMARRFAAQNAHAKAKRLMHGAITASNICLDGRWIDFGTVASMPGYADTRSFGMVPYTLTFWSDRPAYVKIISDLCFYLVRFSKKLPAPSAALAQHLMQVYDRSYHISLTQAFTWQCGFSFAHMDRVKEKSSIFSLGNYLLKHVRKNSSSAFAPSSPQASLLDENPLETLLPYLAQISYDSHRAEPNVANRVSVSRELDQLYRTALLGIFDIARKDLPGLSLASFSKQVHKYACERNSSTAELHRQVFLSNVEKACVSYVSGDALAVQNFIDATVERAQRRYAD